MEAESYPKNQRNMDKKKKKESNEKLTYDV